MKKLSYVFLATVLAFGAVVVPGNITNVHAAGVCEVENGTISIEGVDGLCVINEPVYTINYTGSIEDFVTVLNAYKVTEGWGFANANGASINAFITNAAGVSTANIDTLANYTPELVGTVIVIPSGRSDGGDLIYDGVVSYTLPEKYAINYDNVVVHLPEGSTEAEVFAVYKKANNPTVTVAAGAYPVAAFDEAPSRNVAVVHLNPTTSLADAMAAIEDIRATDADSTFAVAAAMNYWIKSVPGAEPEIYVLNGDYLADALAQNTSTVYVHMDITVDTLNVPTGKTLVELDSTLTVTDIQGSSIAGDFVRADGNEYHIVKIEEEAGGTASMSTEAGALKTPADFVKVGDVVEVSVSGDGDEYVIVNGTPVTTDEGSAFLMQDSDISISAYNYNVVVTPGENDEIEDETEATTVADFVANQIKSLIKSGESTNDNLWTFGLSSLPAYLARGANLTTEMETWLIDEADWEYDVEAYDKVMAEVGENETIAGIYGALLRVYLNSERGQEYLGLVYQLDEPVTMRLEIPEAYRNAPLGYTRNFYVIRGHMAVDESETAERIAATRDGNYLVFENDKYSSFVIVYEDVPNPVITPETGVFTTERSGDVTSVSTATESMLIIVMTTLVLLGLVGMAKTLRSRK